MKQRIISISRRTDIPAFYGDWFMNRVQAGFAGAINPFGGQKYRIDLRPESVVCLAFWSKNYSPFMPHLQTLTEMGHRCFFNFTITGLPHEFECNLVHPDEAVETMKRLADKFSSDHISWRYDPILITDHTTYDWHVARFAELAGKLRGSTKRCYFSFAIQYGKVQRNFDEFKRQQRIQIEDPDLVTRQRLANAMADIGQVNGMTLYSCCGDVLVDGRIQKAHCVDGDIIRKLFDPFGTVFKTVPTRKECGCAESSDIGAYDTCPHGCVYCYANINKARALTQYQGHDPESAFLGYSKVESDAWVAEMPKQDESAAPKAAQMSLF